MAWGLYIWKSGTRIREAAYTCLDSLINRYAASACIFAY